MKKVYIALAAILAWVVFKDFTPGQSFAVIAIALFFAMAIGLYYFEKEEK